jgi:hypothetical protein
MMMYVTTQSCHVCFFLTVILWQARELKVREAFQILTQGVEMVHYDASARRGASKLKKIVWLVPANDSLYHI